MKQVKLINEASFSQRDVTKGAASNMLRRLRTFEVASEGVVQMENAHRDRELLDVIGSLASKGESGRLQITAGMTEGAVFFDKGELVEARFGKLTGLQAINAVASIPDADFSFDASIAPPADSSISANERILLKDFFGIGGTPAELHTTPSDYQPPEKVVPLREVEDPPPSALDVQSTAPSAPHFVNEESSLSTPSFTEISLHPPDTTQFSQAPDHEPVADHQDEATLLRPKAARAGHRAASPFIGKPTPRIRTVLLLTALTVIVAVAVGAFVYRFLERNSPPPVAGPAKTSSNAPQETATAPAASDGDSAADLTGNWKVVNTVERTSYKPYQNLKVGFDIAINQSGNEFIGKGEKVSENGRTLARESRTPISVKGSIDGDRVEATFSETSGARNTGGRFVWTVDRSSHALVGSFVSSAAGSSGKSAATKKLSTH